MFDVVTLIEHTFRNRTHGVQKIVPRLCGYCGGAVLFIAPFSTLLHWIGFNVMFEILF